MRSSSRKVKDPYAEEAENEMRESPIEPSFGTPKLGVDLSDSIDILAPKNAHPFSKTQDYSKSKAN